MQATEIDVTVNLFRYYAQEAYESDPELGEQFDVDSVIETIRTRNIHPEYCWFNVYDNNRPVGFISACVTQAPWNLEIYYAHVELVYVLKSHRNIQVFRDLLENVEAWAKQYNVVKITASDIGVDLDRTRKVYSSVGFKEGLWMEKELTYE